MLRTWIITFVLTAFTIAPALAEKLEPVEYAPDYCEFTVTFPSKPYKTRKCDENNTKSCYDSISYTQVYNMNSSVNIRVSCNKISEEMSKQYNKGIMKATLDAMARQSNVGAYEIRYRDDENYKQAGFVGQGKVGRTPSIAIGQLWIGKTSAFVVEAQLVGDQHEGADKLFSEVLRSVHQKDWKAEEESGEKTAEEKPSEEVKSEKDTKPTEQTP